MNQPLSIIFNGEVYGTDSKIHLGRLIANLDESLDWHTYRFKFANSSPKELGSFVEDTNLPKELYTVEFPELVEPLGTSTMTLKIRASKLFKANLDKLYFNIDYSEIKRY